MWANAKAIDCQVPIMIGEAWVNDLLPLSFTVFGVRQAVEVSRRAFSIITCRWLIPLEHKMHKLLYDFDCKDE